MPEYKLELTIIAVFIQLLRSHSDISWSQQQIHQGKNQLHKFVMAVIYKLVSSSEFRSEEVNRTGTFQIKTCIIYSHKLVANNSAPFRTVFCSNATKNYRSSTKTIWNWIEKEIIMILHKCSLKLLLIRITCPAECKAAHYDQFKSV